MRVGISTGIVVIGEAAAIRRSPSGAVGEATNIAARLQRARGARLVIIAEATSRLISARFEQEPSDRRNSRASREPIRAFRVHGVREDSSRFQGARASGALTPLVGRRNGASFLQQRWRDASAGEGQVVYISGVPGHRKIPDRPRARAMDRRRAAFRPPLPVPAPPHAERVLPGHPADRAARRSCPPTTPARRSSTSSRVARADHRPGRQGAAVHRGTAVDSDGVAIRSARAHPAAGEDPDIVRARRAAARPFDARPVFCLVEDAQWIDPSTQELLDLLVGPD